MSQDAEQPRSRRELRRLQLSEQNKSAERAYPSVPLLPPMPPEEEAVASGSSPEELALSAQPRDDVPEVQGSARHALSSEAQAMTAPAEGMTRQQLRAKERAVQTSTQMPTESTESTEFAAEPAVDPAKAPQPELPVQQTGHGAAAEPESTLVPGPRRRHLAAEAVTIDSLPSRRQLREGAIATVPVQNALAPNTSMHNASVQSAGEPENAANSSSESVSQPEAATMAKRIAERPSQLRARDRAALRAYRELSQTEPDSNGTAAAQEELPSRRKLRQQVLNAESGLNGASSGDSASTQKSLAQAEESQQPGALEQESLMEATRHHLDSLPVQDDPLTVDLEVLAEQKKLAERAAIVNQRAEARAALARENAAREAVQAKLNDPTTAHNLAMVTPAQFIQVPGLDRPVPKPPATAHVPIVTRGNDEVSSLAVEVLSVPAPETNGSVLSDSESLEAPAVGAARGAETARSAASGGERTERSAVLRRAAEVAQQHSTSFSEEELESSPLPANSAHGLEPLDAYTAGLAQARRARLWQWVIVAAGAVALVLGVTLTIFTMTR
ncbi:hypothetical protein ODZ83_00520 [Acaricomes phytoseiuli]|uniref:hypothetical protein n=1 Tax=Acaricomes phytoseiuli TaxID=291968 RepID=UPI002221F362|nr:hypothetical protein [Acaricomes phytoseiuli]MCW1248698.1 hypothetical protein [Acaricomes phytoseiuli]